MGKFRGIICCVLIAVSLQATVGCGGDEVISAIKERNKTNCGKLVTCYCLFKARKGQGPKNSEELFEFIRTSQTISRGVKNAELDLDNLEDLLISERDQKPFRVKWGIDGDGIVPIVFEEVGVDGKRLVGGAKIEELETQEYDVVWKSNAARAMRALNKEAGEEFDDEKNATLKN